MLPHVPAESICYGASPPALNPNHLANLRASTLTDATIAANGIYSENDPDCLRELLGSYLSLKSVRAMGPVLCFPFRDADGTPMTWHSTAENGETVPLPFVRVRPDKPRLVDGKPAKYEGPLGSGNRLYIPAGVGALLTDPSKELIIVEGEKKALAATQAGFPAVAISGVWNWPAKRPKSQEPTRGIRPRKMIDDLEKIAWKARRVRVIFDSDLRDKPEVEYARRCLLTTLRSKGAGAVGVTPPAGPDGAKWGLDDYLLARGPDALRDLIAAVEPTPDPATVPVDPDQYTESGYTVKCGATYHCVLTRDKDTGELNEAKRTKLANFAARIVGETISDDGAEQAREFAVSVQQLNKPATTATVPVEKFNALYWVVEKCGPRYVIEAGDGKRDHLRCAIQQMSGDDLPTNTLYKHTGWREIAGQWRYLHAGGAIGPVVPVVPVSGKVETRLDGPAAAFALPTPPEGECLRAAIRASLGILDGLVLDTIGFPLLASVYRAVLDSPDYALWLAGQTGVQKSELAALAQQHFGPAMNRSHLPGNWSSTDNALEALAFTLKNALLVVDDFAPATNRNDSDRQHRTAERLIRGQGNHSGRGRMRADLTMRPPKPPRGLILATGEDTPRGHSIAARLCIVEIHRGNVSLRRLSECQRQARDGLYAEAMAGFVGWLAPQYAVVLSRLDNERIELRNHFVGMFPHARTPDLTANLLLGLRYLLRFAEHVQAIDQRQHQELWDRGQKAFLAIATQQEHHHRAVDPISRFPEMVRSIVSSGRGHVAGRDGHEPGIPPSPEAWGWECRQFRSGPDETGVNYHGRGRKIGWVEGEELYLDPDAAYAALSELAREQGQTYTVTPQTLWRRLKESEFLLRFEKERTTWTTTLEGIRRPVLTLAVPSIFGQQGQPGQPGRTPEIPRETDGLPCPSFPDEAPKPGHKTGPPAEATIADLKASVPVSCPGFSDGSREPGHTIDAKTPEKPLPVPVAPVVPVSGEEGGAKLKRRYRNNPKPHKLRGDS